MSALRVMVWPILRQDRSWDLGPGTWARTEIAMTTTLSTPDDDRRSEGVCFL